MYYPTFTVRKEIESPLAIHTQQITVLHTEEMHRKNQPLQVKQWCVDPLSKCDNTE